MLITPPFTFFAGLLFRNPDTYIADLLDINSKTIANWLQKGMRPKPATIRHVAGRLAQAKQTDDACAKRIEVWFGKLLDGDCREAQREGWELLTPAPMRELLRVDALYTNTYEGLRHLSAEATGRDVAEILTHCGLPEDLIRAGVVKTIAACQSKMDACVTIINELMLDSALHFLALTEVCVNRALHSGNRDRGQTCCQPGEGIGSSIHVLGCWTGSWSNQAARQYQKWPRDWWMGLPLQRVGDDRSIGGAQGKQLPSWSTVARLHGILPHGTAELWEVNMWFGLVRIFSGLYEFAVTPGPAPQLSGRIFDRDAEAIGFFHDRWTFWFEWHTKNS